MYTHGKPFNLQGVYIIDPVISDDLLQADGPAYDFSVQNQITLRFPHSDVTKIKAATDKCKLTNFVENNLVFPP